MPGILNAEVMIGFGWADSPHSSASVAVVANDEASLPLARREARRLAQAMWDRRREFTFDQEVASSADEAIRARPLGAGVDGVPDGLGRQSDGRRAGRRALFLSRLLALRVPDAVLAGHPGPGGGRGLHRGGSRRRR